MCVIVRIRMFIVFWKNDTFYLWLKESGENLRLLLMDEKREESKSLCRVLFLTLVFSVILTFIVLTHKQNPCISVQRDQ